MVAPFTEMEEPGTGTFWGGDMEFFLGHIQSVGPDTPVELLGKLSHGVFKRGRLSTQTAVMEDILKEVRFELAFW